MLLFRDRNYYTRAMYRAVTPCQVPPFLPEAPEVRNVTVTVTGGCML